MLYFLNFSYTPNTASENRLQAYYSALDKMGIKATVVYVHPDNNYSKIPSRFTNITIKYLWYPFMIYRGMFRKLTMMMYLKKFVKKLKGGDVVYTYSVNLMTKMCEEVNGVRVYAERTEHPAASDGFLHPLLALTKEEMEDCLKRLSGLFVISQPLKSYYESLGVDASRIHIINMIVDSQRFEHLQNPVNKERYIAYCGNASNNKDGVDQLIKAFAIVSKNYSEIKLYIIGKPLSDKDKTGNMQLIKKLGIEDKIVFKGLIPSSEMPQVLKDAEVLALARPNNLQAKFGFPTKLGEYLLSGNPVVITKVGDIPLFLKDGESALIAEPDNLQSFADKLCWAIEHQIEAKEIGKRGKLVAEESFNSFIEAKKIINIINCKQDHDKDYL